MKTCQKAFELYKAKFHEAGLNYNLIFDGIAPDGVLMIYTIHSYGNKCSNHHENLLLLLQVTFVREIYERSMVNPIELLTYLDNEKFDLPIKESFSYIKGCIHHLAAYSIWVLDFGAYLVRMLYLHSSTYPEPEAYGPNF